MYKFKLKHFKLGHKTLFGSLIMGGISILVLFIAVISYFGFGHGKSADELRNEVIDNNFKAYQTPTVNFTNVAYASELESKTKVFDAEGNEIGVGVEVSQNGNGTKVTVNETQQFTPGKYTVEIVVDGQKIDQDFTWGVLAINPNKATYNLNETANLAIAVLDEKGKMACDAEVTLNIKTPLGITTTLSTKDESIIVNPECSEKKYTEKPDFETNYKLGGEGVYQLDLTATTKNGTYSIKDFLAVSNNQPFEVERKIATRLFPYSIYPAVITIKANRDFNGVIKEIAPLDFKISTLDEERSAGGNVNKYTGITNNNGVQEIAWDINIKGGQTIKLGYNFKAPLVSPQFYLLGPLIFSENGQTVFEEIRQWQLANDDLVTTSYSTKILNTSGLVAYWRLGEASGLAMDATGNHNATTIGGSPTYSQIGAISNDTDTAITFNGTDNNFYATDTGFPTGSSARTIEAWVKTTSSSTSNDVFGYGINSSNSSYAMRINNGALQLIKRDSAGTGYDVYNFGGNVKDGAWHHAVITFDGTTAYGFIDGVQIGSGVTPTVNTSLPNGWRIGVWSNWFNGTIDEVAVYNRALGSGEVRIHYAMGGEKSSYYSKVMDTGPVGYWKLGESSGTTAYAEVGDDGTYYNTPTLGQTGLVSGDSDTSVYLDGASLEKMQTTLTAGGSTVGYSAEMWVNADTLSYDNWYRLMSWGRFNTPEYGWLLSYRHYDATTYGFNLNWYDGSSTSSTNLYSTTQGAFLENGPHHLVVVHDYANKLIHFYVDGKEFPNSPVDVSARGVPGAIPASREVAVGMWYGNSLNPMYGYIDEPAIYNSLLDAETVKQHYFVGAPSYKASIMKTPGIMGYWRLGEASGTTAYDATGLNNLTYFNSPTLGVTGVIPDDSDTAVTFVNASSQNVYNNTATGLPSGDSPFTYEAWIKTTGTTNIPEIMGRGFASGDNFIVGRLYGGRIYAYTGNQNHYFTPASPPYYNDGAWHHIVFTYDGTTMKAYADGAHVGTDWTPTDLTITVSPTTFRIGGGYANYFDGTIDEAAIYNVALTPAQIRAHYYVGKKSDPGLMFEGGGLKLNGLIMQ